MNIKIHLAIYGILTGLLIAVSSYAWWEECHYGQTCQARYDETARHADKLKRWGLKKMNSNPVCFTKRR